MTDDSTLSDFLPSSETDETDERRSSGSGASIDADGADSDDDDVDIDADATDADTDADADAADGDSAEPTDGKSPTAPVTGDTGLSTYAWGSYTCAHCDAKTDRVWRADGALVCPDCKPW